MQLHLITPGRFADLADRWAADYPALGARKAYQLNTATEGVARKHPTDINADGKIDDADGDRIVAAINPCEHLARLDARLTVRIPEGSTPGLISVNDETCHPWWYAERHGRPRETWMRLLQAYIVQARHSIAEQLGEGEGWSLGLYGWPQRPFNPQNSVHATDRMLGLFDMLDVITPVQYDPAPGEEGRDLRDVAFMMAESARLSAMLGNKPIVVQLAIRHKGDRELVGLVEWQRTLDQVLAWRGRCNLAGLALWSNGNFEDTATETDRAMREGGYADVLAQRLAA